jgi:Ca2+/H+ antiporter, TMEM165/GDT1 family
MLALLAVLIAGLGARDQLTVAALSRNIGQRPATLVMALAVCCATATFAGWAATTIAPLMTGPARHFLAALALAFAGGEALLLPPGRSAKEATHSLAALTIVLFAQQLTDAARFLIFGIALATGEWIPSVLGGAIGGIVLLSAAWAVPELFTWQRLRRVRRGLGVAMLLVALWLALPVLDPR